jgi:peptidoglycan/xylan/chitin deacetylase (PgdA/CDA1 family)
MKSLIANRSIKTVLASANGWGWIALLAGIVFALPVRAQFCVLLYHAHANLGYSEARFIEQMDFLKTNDYHTVTPGQLLDWLQYRTPLPIRPVLITVDDNYLDVFASMFPILRTRGQIAVNFTPTNLVGVSSSLQYCTWLQLNTMESTGVFLTESHTRRHPYLTTLSPSEMSDEIYGSKAAIETNIAGKQCDYIAYPYGDYNVSIMQACYEANYRAAFAVSGGLVYPDTNRFEIPRNDVGFGDLNAVKQLIGYNKLPPAPPGAGWTIDNPDVNFYGDTWQAVTAAGTYGNDYCVPGAETGNEPARWAAYLPREGWYRVYAWWPQAEELTSQAQFEIHHANGVKTVLRDQSMNGGRWNLLAMVRFRMDQPASVILQPGANGVAAADGIWFEPLDHWDGLWQTY